MGIGTIPPQYAAALDRSSTVVRGCQRMIELGSRHPLASANRGTRYYPLRIESKEGLRPTQTVPLLELAESNRHVAADNHRTPTSLDNDHLQAACVARRRDKPEPGKELELAVDRHVPHAGRLDPLANGVVVLAARVVELSTLDV